MSNFYEDHHLDAEDLTTLLSLVHLRIKTDEALVFTNDPAAEMVRDVILDELKELRNKLGFLYHHEVEVYHND